MPSSLPHACKSFVRSTLTLVIAGVSLLNTACGLKAPLYLPDEKEQEVAPANTDSGKRRATPRPAPQAPKQDRIDAGKSQDVPASTPPPSGN